MNGKSSPKSFEENLRRCYRYQKLLEDTLEAVNTVASENLTDLQIILYCLIRRTVELSRTAIQLLQNENWTPGILCTRATGESVALMIYVCEKWQNREDGLEAKRTQSELFKRIMLGCKTDDKMAKPVHVLDAIRIAEKRVEHFSMFYDNLSEFAHPNAFGLYGNLNKSDRRYFHMNAESATRTEEMAKVLSGTFLRICLAQAVQHVIANNMLTPMIRSAQIAKQWKREVEKTTH